MTEPNENLDRLIDDLSQDLSPAKKVLRPFARITPWIIIIGAYLTGVIHFLGLRMDWREKLSEAAFVFELSLAAALSVFAAYAAGWLAIPDMRRRSWLLVVPVTLLGTFMLFILCQTVSEGAALPKMSWHHCFSDALLMTFVPIASLSVLVRGGATTRPYWMAAMSVMSVGALGWIAQRLTCSADLIGHTMMFHFLPIVLLACLIGTLARRLYRW